MTPTTPVPARLFVLLAREAPIGVILRRGPYRWVQLIKWNTADDTFEPGQWLRARVSEYAGDLSPDGSLLLYSAYRPYNHRNHPGYGDQWIAISKPPYFTALALWERDDSYLDGRFLNNHTIQLYDGHFSQHPNHPIPENLNVTYDLPQYLPHPRHDEFLHLRGWEPLQPVLQPSLEKFYSQVDRGSVWRKQSNNIEVQVRHLEWINGAPGGSGNQFEYILANQLSGQHFTLDDATWADFDQQNRLVFAKNGKLFSAVVQNDELTLTELADFNANKPDPAPSPDWAKKW